MRHAAGVGPVERAACDVVPILAEAVETPGFSSRHSTVVPAKRPGFRRESRQDLQALRIAASAIERKKRLIDGRLTCQPKRPASSSCKARTDHRDSDQPNFSGDCTTTVASFCQTLRSISGGRPSRF
jgi:hypothetical protein